MKSYLILLTLLTPFIFLTCSSENSVEQFSGLTDQEKTDLLFSLEEEKMARDVYLFSYDLYGMNIFSNISNSEQRHMDAVAGLLTTYDLEDPSFDERGKFSNQSIQALYDDLVDQAERSLTDALLAGAKIEDIDIRDLKAQIQRTHQPDIKSVYKNLVCASGNHMRAFVGQLTARDIQYQPQFLSVDDFEAIVNGEHEHCGR